MIKELLSTALLACSLGAGIYKDEPKRVVAPNQYQSYYCEIRWVGSVKFVFSESKGEEHTLNFPGWGKTASYSSPYCTASFTPEIENVNDPASPFTISVNLTFENFGMEEDRFEASFEKVQKDTSTYTTSTGGLYWDTSDVDDSVEMFLNFEGTYDNDYNASFSVTFPMVYELNVQTFGTIENNSREYLTQGEVFSKTFNAIYTDNTEPKHYAFWIDKYMLSRQVRLNGEIINQNYVTALDGIDPSFGKQVSVRFSISDDSVLKVSATPYDPTWSLTNDYNRGYNNGYEAGKTEGQQPVSWIKTTFDGIASFFNIQVFPFVTLGFLCFAPLIVVAIVAILRIIKHD